MGKVYVILSEAIFTFKTLNVQCSTHFAGTLFYWFYSSYPWVFLLDYSSSLYVFRVSKNYIDQLYFTALNEVVLSQ